MYITPFHINTSTKWQTYVLGMFLKLLEILSQSPAKIHLNFFFYETQVDYSNGNSKDQTDTIKLKEMLIWYLHIEHA